MTENWYALHSHPRKENQLHQQVLLRNIETYYPRIPVHPVNPRARKIKPYFPGYMFIYVDLEVTGLSMFQWMPFAVGLVSFGGEPSIVPGAVIQLLRQKVGEIVVAGGQLFRDLAPGDPVTIQSGPFARYSAIFDMRISGTDRVRVLLKMLNDRLVPIDLPVSFIEKKK
jgi:transcription antitermination factor NusG